MTDAQGLSASIASPRPRTPSVRVLRHMADLAAIGGQWNALACQLGSRSPVTAYSWVTAHLETQPTQPGQWVCLAAFDGDRLLGVWPIGTYPGRLLGRNVLNLGQPGTNRIHTVDAVIWPGREREVMLAFRECLDQISPSWFGLELRWVDHRSPWVVPTTSPWPHCTLIRHAVGQASIIPTAGSWDDFKGRLSRNFRRHLQRSLRRLADAAAVRTEFLSGDAADPEHLGRYLRLETAGWKGLAGSSLAQRPDSTYHYSVLCSHLHRSRMLEWHFLQADGQDIAGQMAVRSGRTLYIYRVGYDESWSRYAPGVLLMEACVARALSDPDTDEINLVSHRDWHENWLPRTQPYYHIWVYPHRFRSLVFGAWPKQVRQTLRRIPAARRLARALRGEVIEGSPIQSRRDFLRRQGEAKHPDLVP